MWICTAAWVPIDQAEKWRRDIQCDPIFQWGIQSNFGPTWRGKAPIGDRLGDTGHWTQWSACQSDFHLDGSSCVEEYLNWPLYSITPPSSLPTILSWASQSPWRTVVECDVQIQYVHMMMHCYLYCISTTWPRNCHQGVLQQHNFWSLGISWMMGLRYCCGNVHWQCSCFLRTKMLDVPYPLRIM